MSCEGELVSFKETTIGVDEHGVSDTVDKIIHSDFDFFVWLGALDSFLEYHVKGLKKYNVSYY